MPKEVVISSAKLVQTARFASLLLDFTFKKVFTTEECKYLLINLIEVFLQGYLQAKIVDVELLPNEKINKTRRQRSAVFDLHCKDSDGNKFIIEVQISKQDNFIGRLLFYISQTISGLAKKGRKYNFNYPRVYSLSFLNFEPEPDDKTSKVIEHICLVNLGRSKKRYPHIHITLVMLTRFNKKLEQCKTACELWLYLFKNMHKLKMIPSRFNNRHWRSVFDVAEISNFNDVELRSYEANMKYSSDYENTIEYAKKEGEARGEEKGVLKGILKVAKNMHDQGLKPRTIARYTELPLKQIMALR